MLNIVVVEDEFMLRNGLCQLIPRWDPEFHIVVSAENGYDGMNLIRKLQPDVAICDIRMKKTNGLDMIQQLSETQTTCKFIILSGYSEFAYAQTAIRLGVIGYLLKPIIPDELLSLLEEINSSVSKSDIGALPVESEAYQYSELIFSAVQKIERHYQNDISLISTAEELGVSSSYLSSRFTAETGENFMLYLKKYRIKKACELLESTDKKMYEIAFLVGYDNPQYFSNVFKSVMGITPKAYLRNRNPLNT